MASKTDFPAFSRAMGRALKLGRTHREEGRVPATPLELLTSVKFPASGATAIYLREAYLAGFNFTETITPKR